MCKAICQNLGADIYLDEAYDSGISGCPGARFMVRLNQPVMDAASVFEEEAGPERTPLNHESKVGNTRQVSGSLTDPDQVAPRADEEELPVNMSVLFVDDDPMLRKLFTRALERASPPGWVIQKASNGETAIRMVDDQTFDLIFMDQFMASTVRQLLGTETVHALRSKGCRSIFCGLSANDLEGEFLKNGANAFMSKPFPCDPKAPKKEIIKILQTGNSSLDAADKV